MELVSPSKPAISQCEQEKLDIISRDSLESAETLLGQFFSATDDLFYELSERASTNNEENLYFEAMRAIRVSRKGIINNFVIGFQENFTQIISRQDPAETSDDDSELAVLDRDELEMSLAKKNMSDRTRETYKQELYDLEARLDQLLSNCKINSDNNPLDPTLLASCFINASMGLIKLDIKTRLIFFKLFEKHFLKQLGHIYAAANETLVQAGILPKVPRKAVNKQDAQPNAIAQQEEDIQNKNFTPFNYGGDVPPFQLESSALSSLMASIRAARKANVSGAEQLGNYHYFSANPGIVMPVPELANLLTDTQEQTEARLVENREPKNLVPEIVTHILSKRNPEEPQALDQPDEDIINLVALFFDKVLEDESLPLALQSLICRLQIPVLKVALNDKSFLTKEDHPARAFINTITEVGIGFDETKPIEKDPLYRALAESVHNINHEFKLDSSVFTSAILSLRKAVLAERNRSNAVEARTKQTEEGKAKLNAARSFAQNSLYEKLKDLSLPNIISEFLTNTWLQVLVITFVKSGKDSAEWVQNEQLISDLIWASQKHDDKKSIARQQRLLPELIQHIENGLEFVIDNLESRRLKASEIEKVLQDIVDQIGPKPLQPLPLSEKQKNHLGKSKSDDKTWEEMTALERQQVRFEELTSRYYLEAKNMPLETWLEYITDETSKKIRCKLSAKLDSDNYVFVNRFGFKTLTRTRRQFAYDMQFKKAKPLDTTPIFERIMERVVTHIKLLSKDI